MFTIPSATSAFVFSLYLFRRTSFLARSRISLAIVASVFMAWTQFRMQGVDGDLNSEFCWRWGTTDEEIFLKKHRPGTESNEILENIVVSQGDCPEFREIFRDGVVRGQSIQLEWPELGLTELWRQRVGPGWSSFAVVDDWVFTQEQRGDEEVISAYSAQSGNERWNIADKMRFSESISGVGPRATPTFSGGKLFTMGPSGIVRCTEATTGNPIWKRDICEDTGANIPMWGFSSSPLVIGQDVIVFAGAGKDKALVSYDIETGNIRWQSGNGYLSYSSPQLATLHDIPQVLMMTENGLSSFNPSTGTFNWAHEWELGGGSARIIQPKVVGNDVIVGTGYGVGTRRISTDLVENQWTTNIRWTTKALKPYFNDFVVSGNFIYGFDKNIFT
ncbi:MAG: PQQ-binding-like beta-propeller repeat protein [Planctomycetota bacterium]